ncbi:MAG TPA: hypothetical protein VD902_21025, partial [Symbiobacteriaceae bacterium]|nr:hypothetical protein [Symbiobacteriaceae bacterium]
MAFTYSLATPADDADIRRLLRENPVPGHLTLGYEREPDFFLGCTVVDRFAQVILARHKPTGELAGLFCRSVRPVYLNGEPQEVGYLSGLRVAPRFRGRWLVSRGVAMLRELDGDGRAPGYFATMIEGNGEAEAVLVSKARPHFPVLRAVERLASVAVMVGRAGSDVPGVSWASRFDLAEMTAFV